MCQVGDSAHLSIVSLHRSHSQFCFVLRQGHGMGLVPRLLSHSDPIRSGLVELNVCASQGHILHTIIQVRDSDI